MPHTEPPPRSGLVWVVDAEGRHWTHWVALEDGGPLASLPIEGPLWADDDALWQWRLEPVERPTFDEEPTSGAPAADEATGVAIALRGVMRELVTDAEAVVIEAPDPGTVRGLSHDVALEASIGPYVFVSEVTRVEAWGAHGSAEARSIVWDLRAAMPVEVLTERERLSVVPEGRERARQALIREGHDAAVPTTLAAEDIELVALRPAWDVDHGLRLELQFATSACYACGDGRFGDYTRSAVVEVAALPERVAEHGRIPEWAREAAVRVGAELRGFSIVSRPDPARILGSLRR